jgi:serine/threonine protein kinase
MTDRKANPDKLETEKTNSSKFKPYQSTYRIRLPKSKQSKCKSSEISPKHNSHTRRSSLLPLQSPIIIQKESPNRPKPLKLQSKSSKSLHPSPPPSLGSSSHRRLVSDVLLKTRPKRKLKLLKPDHKSKQVSSLRLSKDEESRLLLINYIKNSFLSFQTCPETTVEFYKTLSLIGKGAYSKVILCRHRLTNKKVAIKAIPKAALMTEYAQSKVIREIFILKTVKSQFVVKILEVFESEKNVLIVLEYAGEDLLSFVKGRGKLGEKEARVIFEQVVRGAVDVHDAGVIHRDFKLENILIDPGCLKVKICDFGVSRVVEPDEVIFDQCGTPAYIAPEVIRNQGYSGFSLDVWSLGVVLFTIVSGRIPFAAKTIEELHELILQGKYEIPAEFSLNLCSLIRKMLTLDPSNRITTEMILKHPWLSTKDSPEQEVDIKPRKIQFKENEDLCMKSLKTMNNFGFPSQFIIESLKNKELNHATATYTLLDSL